MTPVCSAMEMAVRSGARRGGAGLGLEAHWESVMGPNSNTIQILEDAAIMPIHCLASVYTSVYRMKHGSQDRSL